MIRVLHIVGIMNMGGLENFIMNIYRKIDKSKVQFDFLITREEEGIFDKEIISFGGRIYNIPSMEKVGYKRYKKILKNFFKEHNEYKIIHCHRNALSSVYLKEARKSNIPIRIVHSHNTNIVEKKNIKGYIKILVKKYFRLFINFYATDFFACSFDAGKWLYGNKIAESKLTIIKNGIDLSKYNYNKHINMKIRKELSISDDTFLIGHVGRFELQKNHKFLVEILKQLDKDIKKYKLILVGDGILKNEIKDMIKNTKLEEKVMFLGIRKDVNELFMAFDLFLFPSLFEGLPLSLIEAQATGLNCLVSRNISDEVDMDLNILKKLDIVNVDIWVDEIKNKHKNMYANRLVRYSNYDKLTQNGYNDECIGEWLVSFYQQKYNNITSL